jgi:hypothetical protein
MELAPVEDTTDGRTARKAKTETRNRKLQQLYIKYKKDDPTLKDIEISIKIWKLPAYKNKISSETIRRNMKPKRSW